MKYVQVLLDRAIPEGMVATIGWVEKSKNLKEGKRVTLMETGVGIWWNVVKIYSVEKEHDELNKKWNVGGLE